MGRMTPNDANALNSVSLRDRAHILKIYLKRNLNQKEIAAEVYHNYDDWASMSISVVTRSFGFHEGKGKGRYRNIPDHVIDQFVRDYDPVDYDGGLDEGTFDHYIKRYLRDIEQQRQQEEQQRRWQAQQAEEQRRRQAEYERQQAEWAAQQERERQRREAERRQREEAERQERARREREEREREAARQAAADRGDHITLMNEAFDALKTGNFASARNKAQRAWDIQPMVGLQNVFARCFAAEGDPRSAAQWAWDAHSGYEEGSQGYIDMLALHINQNGGNIFDATKKLHKCGKLGLLDESGIKYAVDSLFRGAYRVSGGTRMRNDWTKDDTLETLETLCTMVAYRDYPANRDTYKMLSRCAYFLTEQGYYTMARDIYQQLEEKLDDRGMFESAEVYDIKVNLGKCLYELEDYDGAREAWFPDAGYAGSFVTRPLETGMFYGYDEDMLKLSDNHPEVHRELELADAYRNGRIPGSKYFSRFYGRAWQEVLGVSPNADIKWAADEFGEWELKEFTPGFKDFLGGLFGR